jgi:hypothetical protein
MNVQQLDQTYAGKNLRIEFSDGEICDVVVIEVALPNKYDTTPESWGVVYDLISSNRPQKAPKGAANWAQINDIKSFELLGDKSE